jgi:sugar O-acyltransferase (sialic acid O-acetyltransferase NeuD family)
MAGKIESEPLIICGAGGHARSSLLVLFDDDRFEIAGVLDPDPNVRFYDYPILGDDQMICELIELGLKNFFVGVGQIKTHRVRQKIFENISSGGGELPSFHSLRSFIASDSVYGHGCIFMSNTFVNSGCRIGHGCIVNTGAIVEHDCSVGDYCHISTGVIINGGCNIGEGCFIGSGSVLNEGVTLPHGSVIKSGSVIVA